MTSIKFPKMFNTNSTNVWKPEEHLEATKQNSKLILLTDRGELFGDPFFGMAFKQYLFNQNNYILRDILIDQIYTQLAIFLPQLRINRRDIKVFSDGINGRLICQFSATSQIDYTFNTFELVLFDESQFQ